MRYFNHIRIWCTCLLVSMLIGCSTHSADTDMPTTETPPTPPVEAVRSSTTPDIPEYEKPYLAFMEKVYQTMDEKYYQKISHEAYTQFVTNYREKILSQLAPHTDIINDVLWRGAGLLVMNLKDPSDTFTNFIPPKQAEKYAQTIYGYENGLGIEGQRGAEGYLITHVQLRSDAYLQGIRVGDILRAINDKTIQEFTDETLHEALYPPLDTTHTLTITNGTTHETKAYELLCQQYFKETLIEIPTNLPGVKYLKIGRFNRKTNDDLEDFFQRSTPDTLKYLVIDLTNNPGGPPLAVQAMCSIFLPPGQKLFYYQKKNVAPFGLTTPASDITYTGNLIIVINKGSGSSSELLAGTLQAYKRAMVLGKESTAGMAFLKGAETFDDGSMLAMITGKTFLFDGTEIDTSGVDPDYIIPAETTDVTAFVLNEIKKKIDVETASP